MLTGADQIRSILVNEPALAPTRLTDQADRWRDREWPACPRSRTGPHLDTSKDNSHSYADLETDLETRVTPAHGGVKAEYRSPDLRFG
jgi:hypothetical protein